MRYPPLFGAEEPRSSRSPSVPMRCCSVRPARGADTAPSRRTRVEHLGCSGPLFGGGNWPGRTSLRDHTDLRADLGVAVDETMKIVAVENQEVG